ncbi:MAG: LysM peptidoglycan-binding domain-containing protein [Rhodobacteraceae bacterium]|nr:LysM peptidoglycan-binding domain-containing protein [Paracoccaceae bacterium]
MLQPLIITGSLLSLTMALIWLQPASDDRPLFAPQTALDPTMQDQSSEPIDITAVLARDVAGPVEIEGFGVRAPDRETGTILAQDVEVTRLMAFAGVRPVPRPDNGPVVREPVVETPPELEIVPAVDELPSEATPTIENAPVLIASPALPIPPSAADQDAAPELSRAGPLFAEIAASRSNLLTVTGVDEDGRLRPTLQSLAQNTRVSPNEAPIVDQAELRDVAQAPEAAESASLAARLANSPSTLPIVAAPVTRNTEQARPVLTGQAIEQTQISTPAETLVFGSAEENAALRERLANAPTRAVHTVRLGDSLLTLALRYYGDAAKAEVIFEANRRRLSTDGVLRLGQILRIPDIENL